MDFPFVLQPGQTITVNSRQAYLYYEAGSAGGADASIRISADIGDEIVLKPGQGFRYSSAFNRLYLSNNKGAAPIAGHIILEAGEFFDNRVTGEVSVIDGGKFRSLSQIAFYSGTGVPGAATKYGAVQLFNPAGNTKNLIVTGFVGSVGGPGNVYLLGSVQQLANVNTGAGQKLIKAAYTGTTGQIRNEQCAAIPSNIDGMVFYTANLAAGGTTAFQLHEPLIITPGHSLMFYTTAAQTEIFANFEYFEDGL
jgi:hypothetical protein